MSFTKEKEGKEIRKRKRGKVEKSSPARPHPSASQRPAPMAQTPTRHRRCPIPATVQPAAGLIPSRVAALGLLSLSPSPSHSLARLLRHHRATIAAVQKLLSRHHPKPPPIKPSTGSAPRERQEASPASAYPLSLPPTRIEGRKKNMAAA